MSLATARLAHARASCAGASASTARPPRALARAAGRRAAAHLVVDGPAHARRLGRSAGPARAGARWLALAWHLPPRAARRAAPGLARAGAAPARCWPRCCARAALPPLPSLRAARPCWRSAAALLAFLPRARRLRAGARAVACWRCRCSSSLQFYAGYPLRVVTAEASRWLLAPGFTVERDGSEPAGGRPAGHRRCALLRRADGSGWATSPPAPWRCGRGARRPRRSSPRLPAVGAAGAGRQHRCATACWWRSKRPACRWPRGPTTPSGLVVLAVVCGGIALDCMGREEREPCLRTASCTA